MKKHLKPIFRPIRRLQHHSDKQFRAISSSQRALPDFIIIGGQRCGTTTLYHYLCQHPHIIAAGLKEIHFFDNDFQRGSAWYQSHFPLRWRKNYSPRQPMITGEASPYYLVHPHAPARIAALCPQVKLIVMLRNPVKRAYSHYHHEVRWGFESVSTFEEAIALEPWRLRGEVERMQADEAYYSFSHHHHSYINRGIYIEQLQQWHRYFPPEQLFIINSEQFYRQPQQIHQQVVDFLALPPHTLPDYGNKNRADNPRMAAGIQQSLARYFEPYNHQLFAYVGRDFGWNDTLKRYGRNE